MSDSLITFRGIAPIYSPISLHLGVDQFSKAFTNVLNTIDLENCIQKNSDEISKDWHGKFFHFGGEQSEKRQYQSTKSNSKDVRLMCWTPADNTGVMFHVFSNNIAIVEVEISIDISEFTQSTNESEIDIELIEDSVQRLSKEKIDIYFNDFCDDLLQLESSLSDDFVYSTSIPEENVNWVARTMLLNDAQLVNDNIVSILTAWLKKTRRPQDATDIIAGDKGYSMTWLNYVVKTAKSCRRRS